MQEFIPANQPVREFHKGGTGVLNKGSFDLYVHWFMKRLNCFLILFCFWNIFHWNNFKDFWKRWDCNLLRDIIHLIIHHFTGCQACHFFIFFGTHFFSFFWWFFHFSHFFQSFPHFSGQSEKILYKQTGFSQSGGLSFQFFSTRRPQPWRGLLRQIYEKRNRTVPVGAKFTEIVFSFARFIQHLEKLF